MTDQERIDELHERVTAWSDKAHANGLSFDFETLMADEEFQGLIGELMEQDEDTLMILLGRAVSENPALMPEWLTEGLFDDDDPS